MIDERTLQIFRLQADICKTLADANRLLILHEIRTGELSVGQLATNLNLTQSNVSRHLAILRQRGIVSTRREGTTIYYSLANPAIGRACDMVREVLETRLLKEQALAGSIGSLKRTSKAR